MKPEDMTFEELADETKNLIDQMVPAKTRIIRKDGFHRVLYITITTVMIGLLLFLLMGCKTVPGRSTTLREGYLLKPDMIDQNRINIWSGPGGEIKGFFKPDVLNPSGSRFYEWPRGR